MDLLKDDLKKFYLRVLIPSLGSAMVMSIYTLTDAIVIGRGVGADALAALSLTTPLLCILMAMGILFGVGGSVQMSVYRGTGNYEKANRFFTLSFVTLAIIATNYGADKWERISKVRNMAFLTIIVMGTIFSMIGILSPSRVCSVFMNMNDEMTAIAQKDVRIYFIVFLPIEINLLTSYYLQSILSVKSSLCISVLRNVFLSSAVIIVFPLIFGGNSLWMAMPTVEVSVLTLSMVFLKNSYL